MARTDTDVIITQYSARFGYPASIATIDFSNNRKQWNLGPWEHRERLTRRRRWTVVADLLTDKANREITDSLRKTHPGLWSNSTDPDARAVLFLSSEGGRGVLCFVEQVKHL